MKKERGVRVIGQLKKDVNEKIIDPDLAAFARGWPPAFRRGFQPLIFSFSSAEPTTTARGGGGSTIPPDRRQGAARRGARVRSG